MGPGISITKIARTRVREWAKQEIITCISFSAAGDLLAYATGYDWSRGHSEKKNQSVKLSIIALNESDVKLKNKR